MQAIKLGLIASILFSSVVSAQEEDRDLDKPVEELLFGTTIWERQGSAGVDLIVAEVISVEKRPATNAKPPHVKLKVIRVIFGDGKIDRSNAVWRPRWPFEWGICGNDSRFPKWDAALFTEYPNVGERFLLTGHQDESPRSLFVVDGKGRMLYSKKRESYAKRCYEKGVLTARKAKAEAEAEEKKRVAAAEAFWTSKLAKADLPGLFADSELVGIGRVRILNSGSVARFEVTELLRGPRLKEYRDNAYFGEVHGGANAFLADYSGQKPLFLLVLRAKGQYGNTIMYELMPGELGIFLLTDELRSQARAWCRDNPLDPSLEKAIVERCEIGNTARNVTYILKASPWKSNSLEAEERKLAKKVKGVNRFLGNGPAWKEPLVREDEQFRTALGEIQLKRSVIWALRSTGLADRGGKSADISSMEAASYRTRAFELLGEAVSTRTLSRKRVENEEGLDLLNDDARWLEILRSIQE
jgi:hypothetical protein